MVDDKYLWVIKNTNTGYAATIAMQMIQHLYQAYGWIKQGDLLKNENNMKEQWDPTTGFEDLVTQINNATNYAAAGDQPYMANQIINIVFEFVRKTALFKEACCK